jgi:hypothetical protein
VHGAAERVRLWPVQGDRSGRVPVGAQRQRQAAAEPGPAGGAAELGPALLRRGVVDPPRLVVAQRLKNRPLGAIVELKAVQLVQPLIGRGEIQGALCRGDRHRRRSAAGNQFDGQLRQPAQRLVSHLVFFQQLCDTRDAVGEFPGNHHDGAPYPEALWLSPFTEAHLRHPGSRLWWMAVSTVLVTTVEHLDREERGPLAASRPQLTMQQRRELGCQYSGFITAWALDAASGEAPPKIIVVLRHKFGPTG